jgi:hypothetical protein
VNEDFGFKRTVRTKVTFVSTPPSQVLQTEGLDATLPAHGVNTIAKGIKTAASLMNAWSKNTVYFRIGTFERKHDEFREVK